MINKGGSELNAVTEVSIGTMDDATLAIYNAEEGVKYKAIPATCYELNGEERFLLSQMYKLRQFSFQKAAILKTFSRTTALLK